MKLTFKILFSSIILILFLQCTKNAEKTAPITVTEIDAEKLWQRITEETNYKNYSQWSGHEGFRLGMQPHGSYHKIFINPELSEQLPISNNTAPNGSIIVKETFTIDKEATPITVMAKIKGYNPEHNDWFWAMYDTQGNVIREGKPAGCINCHNTYALNDYIIVRDLDKKTE